MNENRNVVNNGKKRGSGGEFVPSLFTFNIVLNEREQEQHSKTQVCFNHSGIHLRAPVVFDYHLCPNSIHMFNVNVKMM